MVKYPPYLLLLDIRVDSKSCIEAEAAPSFPSTPADSKMSLEQSSPGVAWNRLNAFGKIDNSDTPFYRGHIILHRQNVGSYVAPQRKPYTHEPNPQHSWCGMLRTPYEVPIHTKHSVQANRGGCDQSPPPYIRATHGATMLHTPEYFVAHHACSADICYTV